MIGIFGDSYAEPTCGNGNLQHESWVNHLVEPAVSYAKGGTSQLWSYRKFLENHEKYDQIVFIMPGALRIDHACDTKDWSGPWAITGINHADRILKEGYWSSVLDPENYSGHTWNIPRVKAIRDFYLHVQDRVASNLQAQLIKEGILSRRPDAFIIPTAEFPPFEWTYMPLGSWCRDYLLLQIRSLFPHQNLPALEFYKHYLEINCVNHFTTEINQLFASHVNRALAGEGWQDWGIKDIPSIPHSRPWDYYYKEIK